MKQNLKNHFMPIILCIDKFVHIKTTYNNYVRAFGIKMNIGTGEYAFLKPGYWELFFLSCLDEDRDCGLFIFHAWMNIQSVRVWSSKKNKNLCSGKRNTTPRYIFSYRTIIATFIEEKQKYYLSHKWGMRGFIPFLNVLIRKWM